MSRLLNYFFKGLLFVVPIAVTVYVAVVIFTTIDGWLRLPIPGVGFVATIALITVIGFFASNIVSRSFLSAFERVLNRLPLVRLLYSSTKDLLDAFVGEKRRFDRPVLFRLTPAGPTAFGFLTQDSLATLGMDGSVAVYMPQSYGWAGNLLVIPAAHVQPLMADSADVMAFIISGGVTAMPERGAVSAAAPGLPADGEGAKAAGPSAAA